MKNKGRPINGVFLLNKPLGISSNLALQKVKRLFQAQKAGHTGSLDPLATGMLPICFGEATKFSQFLLDANKRYMTVAKLGIKTETSDSEGAIVAENPVPHLSLKQLAAILEKFRGPIKQIPSMYSALKHNGKALYKYARDGQVIERPARDIIIHDLRLIHYQDNLLELDVHCSKGTYIRNLVEDIGEAIGCGAHVVKLHRTSVSHLPTKMYTLEQLTALMDQTQAHTMHNDEAFKGLLPIEVLVKDLPSLFIARRDAVKLLQGKLVALSDEPTDLLMDLKQQQTSSMTSIAIYLIDNKEFIGIGSLNANNILRAKRMMSLRLKE